VWGLFKYYIMPLAVYHFWASSFLKTSSLLKLISKIERRYKVPNQLFRISPLISFLAFASDLVTMAHYKYPKWVEFLSCELNYAISTLHQFTTSLNVDLPLEEEVSDSETSVKP